MNARKILVLTDNPHLLNRFRELVAKKSELTECFFTYCCSPASANAMRGLDVTAFWVKKEWPAIIPHYDLVISAHCKQLFPADMVAQVRCVNIHPGLNPYNRGWFPQVFSILNGLPLGATIHEIDKELDHGPIIAQQQVPIYVHDTSLSAYERVQVAELELLDQHIVDIISHTYEVYYPDAEGNLNLKKDYNALCELNLTEPTTTKQVIDLLRALTHGQYRNAFFRDADGRKVYLSLSLEPEQTDL